MQVYNFVSGVLWQLFGLGHSGVWSVTVWGCGQVSFILITVQTDAINTGNKWMTEEPLKEEVTGLWEPAILLVCRWPNTYSPPSFTNKFFKNPTMWFSGFSFLILSLIVEVYLWWKLQASLIFLSGRSCTIGGWLNTFLPHCIYIHSLATLLGTPVQLLGTTHC